MKKKSASDYNNSTENEIIVGKRNILETSKQVIVALGASAGGLEALQDFFKAMPVNNGLAFVVIQHLSPDYKSMMDELLARQTQMKIYIIEDGMKIEPNTVYLIPPRKNLSIFHDQLFLEDYNLKKGLNLPIDIFFRSLALEKGKNGIGIILSGTGSDGALGTRAIKEAGGMVMVQDEQTAKFDGMPRSSISTGLVDFILPPDKMPNTLLDYVKHPFIQKSSIIENILERNYDSLTKITLILRDFCGIDFSYYKGNTIIRRLERRVSINRCGSLDEYLILLSESDKEKDALFRDLLIGVTRFFRDHEAFNTISEEVIPKLLQQKGKSIRIWSAGCSTGEEVYSLAMLIAEKIESMKVEVEVKIFATDIDRQALTIAGQGFYPDNIMADVDAILLNKYFNRVEGGYLVKENIRRMIVFATHNLLKDPPFSKLDILICRNLFIYLKSDIQVRLLSMFYYSLSPGGYLFMGSSETIGDMSEAFVPVDLKNKIYKYKEGFKPEFKKELSPMMTNGLSVNEVQTYSNRFSPNIKSERLLEKILPIYMPPSIIIDSNDNILQIIGDVNKFTSINSGKFSQNLFSILPESLGLYVSSFIRRLRKTRQSIRSENFMEIKDLSTYRLKLEGHCIETDKNIYYIIVFIFDDLLINKSKNIGSVILNEDFNERITSLEHELQLSREALQATIEELETSNEELQSSNEELIASNEELQSTNEELQSVNEELYTVNSEFQLKIDELERLNNDMSNLINNTEVGALYLDRNLCIRKITASISKITNILPADVGRPISHISSFSYSEPIMKDIMKVTESLQIIENEYKDDNGNYYLVRTRPYRVDNNAVDGILITYVNINSFKIEQQKTDITSKRLSDALDFAKMAWWEWDVETGKVIYDAKKATMLGYTVEEFPDDVFEVCNLIHPDDYESTMEIMRNHLYGDSANYCVTYRIKRKDGSYAWYYDRGAISKRKKNGSPLKIIGSVIDVSELKTLEYELSHKNNLLHKAFESNKIPQIVIDISGIITFSNDSARKFIKKITGSELPNSVNDWKYEKLNENMQNPFFINAGSQHEFQRNIQLKLTDNESITLSVNITALLDEKSDLHGYLLNFNE